MDNKKITQLLNSLKSAGKIVVLTGRGIENSAWFNALGEREKLKLLASIPKVATYENLITNPDVVHEWITLYRNMVKKSEPTAIHKYIAQLQRLKDVVVITQAIDGMFYKAGCRKVIELYGNLMENKCPECGRVTYWEENISTHCPRCGTRYRPGIVLFGENFNAEVMEKAFEACSRCDVLLMIDCSMDTSPIPELFRTAQSADVFIVTINEKAPAILRNSTFCIQENSAKILKRIVEELTGKVRTPSPISEILRNIKIGTAQKFENLEIFPLFNDRTSSLSYKLMNDAIASGELVVDEINEGGSVPQLRFKNNGAHKVLILEGEQIVGLKQNRVVNTSILIKEKSELIVPVSCVEQGRWGKYDRSKKAYAESVASAHLRARMKQDLLKNLKDRGTYSADQGRIWEKVEAYQLKAKMMSQTKAYRDYEIALEKRLSNFKKRFKWEDKQVGFIALINGKFAALDIFDKPDVAAKLKDKLIQSCAIDAYDRRDEKQAPKTSKNPQGIIDKLISADWQALAPLGEGEHLETGDEEINASGLMVQNTLIHLSAFPKENPNGHLI